MTLEKHSRPSPGSPGPNSQATSQQELHRRQLHHGQHLGQTSSSTRATDDPITHPYKQQQYNHHARRYPEPSLASAAALSHSWTSVGAGERPGLSGRSVSQPHTKADLVATSNILSAINHSSVSAGQKRPADASTTTVDSLSEQHRPRGKKRKVDESQSVSSSMANSSQRPRPHLDRFSFPGPNPTAPQPPSPLFFSNTAKVQRPRPQLPPRFSSGEAASRMLSKAEKDDGSVRTVQLARGSLVAPSPLVTSISATRSSTTDGSGIETPDIADKADALRILAQVGTIELLEQDNRAVFIVDLADAPNASQKPLSIVWANSSLKSHEGLLDTIRGTAESQSSHASSTSNSSADTEHYNFVRWALNPSNLRETTPDGTPKPVAFADFTWTSATLRRRVRIISGTHATPTPPNEVLSSLPKSREGPGLSESQVNAIPQITVGPQDYFGSATVDTNQEAVSRTLEDSALAQGLDPNKLSDLVSASQTPESTRITPLGWNGRAFEGAVSPALDLGPPIPGLNGLLPGAIEQKVFDWTLLPPESITQDHTRFARNVDWASTPLGPIETWPADLRLISNLVMGSPHPCAAYLGDQYVTIYNEAYIPLAGNKHPKLMGQTYKEAWFEIWHEIEPVFADAMSIGQAIMKVCGSQIEQEAPDLTHSG
jgi:hypothetical protein